MIDYDNIPSRYDYIIYREYIGSYVGRCMRSGFEFGKIFKVISLDSVLTFIEKRSKDAGKPNPVIGIFSEDGVLDDIGLDGEIRRESPRRVAKMIRDWIDQTRHLRFAKESFFDDYTNVDLSERDVRSFLAKALPDGTTEFHPSLYRIDGWLPILTDAWNEEKSKREGLDQKDS